MLYNKSIITKATTTIIITLDLHNFCNKNVIKKLLKSIDILKIKCYNKDNKTKTYNNSQGGCK